VSGDLREFQGKSREFGEGDPQERDVHRDVDQQNHPRLVWERTRHLLRMRSSLREYFPAALEAYADLTLTGADALELLGRAPEPASAARLTVTQITAALKRARRRADLAQRARDIQAALRTPHLARPAVIAGAYGASVQAGAAMITALNEQIKIMEAKVG
jgi:hypothetical protein